MALGDAGFGGRGQEVSWVPTRGQVCGVWEIKGLAVGVKEWVTFVCGPVIGRYARNEAALSGTVRGMTGRVCALRGSIWE